MGGSSAGPLSNNKGIDASVGGLVWVRRRNGSWWPGRIVGLNELSEGCLVSPRSGTPVKLLGRDDASIDWYNLEKSKRVKAFRCGEYDDCIEKAKAAAANSSKKAVKYARREDAILHALEIESARLGKDHPYYFTRMDSPNGRLGTSTTESPTISRSIGKETDGISEDEVNGDSHSTPEMSYSGGAYFDEPSHANTFKVRNDRGMRRRTPNDSEDDGNEGTKRMRGLEDLGMSVVSDKKIQPETTQQENGAAHLSNVGNNNFTSGSPMINGVKGHSSSSLKRKRSQVAHVHDFLRRKNRRRPLTKVLERTAMVSVPITCDNNPTSPLGGLSETKTPGVEPPESNRIFSSAVVDNVSERDGLLHENGISTDVAEPVSNNADQVDIYQKMNKEPSCILEPPENVMSDGLFDVPFVAEKKKSEGFPSMHMANSLVRSPVGVIGRQSSQSQSSQAEAMSFNCEAPKESSFPTSPAAASVDNLTRSIEKSTSKWQSKGKRNSRQLSSKKRRRSIGKSSRSNPSTYFEGLDSEKKEDLNSNIDGSLVTLADCQDKKLNGVCDWGKRASSSSHRRSQTRKKLAENPKLLTEVNLTPQRSLPYRQSRFTVHPRYETDEFPVKSFGQRSDSSLYDIELRVNANYKPPHVPLVSLMSKLNGKAIVGHPLAVEVLDDGGYRDQSFEQVGFPVRKKKNSSRSSSSSRKKPKSRKSGLMSKKMRKLSSLTGQKRGGEDDDDRRPTMVDKLRSPVIACIPLKVVFSRINEAVNGSLRPSNRGLQCLSFRYAGRCTWSQISLMWYNFHCISTLKEMTYRRLNSGSVAGPR